LLERDRWRKSVDQVDVGNAELMEKPARIRGHGFEIPSLRFGIEGAEREGRLSRSGHTSEHHECVPRHIDVHIFQVVLAGTTNTYKAIVGDVAVSMQTDREALRVDRHR